MLFSIDHGNYAIKTPHLSFPAGALQRSEVPQGWLVINTPRMFLVDVGGYTVDVLLLRNSKPDLEFCRSLEAGVITMNNNIIGRVGALHDMNIEDDHIISALRGEETVLPGDVIRTMP